MTKKRRPTPTPPSKTHRRRLWTAGGLAAALGLAVIVGSMWSDGENAEQSGLTIKRSGQTAFWVAPAQGPMLNDGKQLYGMFCAACHGADMQGQANWRDRMANGRLPAPPHDVTGHTWHHPDALLLSMVKDGIVPGVMAPVGYESNMPAFGAALSDVQIKSILAYIKTYWPADVLKAQREISLQ